MSPSVIQNIAYASISIAAITLNHFGIIPSDIMTAILGFTGFGLTKNASDSSTRQTINQVTSTVPMPGLSAKQEMPVPVQSTVHFTQDLQKGAV